MGQGFPIGTHPPEPSHSSSPLQNCESFYHLELLGHARGATVAGRRWLLAANITQRVANLHLWTHDAVTTGGAAAGPTAIGVTRTTIVRVTVVALLGTVLNPIAAELDARAVRDAYAFAAITWCAAPSSDADAYARIHRAIRDVVFAMAPIVAAFRTVHDAVATCLDARAVGQAKAFTAAISRAIITPFAWVCYTVSTTHCRTWTAPIDEFPFVSVTEAKRTKRGVIKCYAPHRVRADRLNSVSVHPSTIQRHNRVSTQGIDVNLRLADRGGTRGVIT